MRKKNEVRFTLRIAPRLNDLLGKESKSQCLTKNALITQILWEHVRRYERHRDPAA